MTLDRLKQLAITAKAQGSTVVLGAPELLEVLDRVEQLERQNAELRNDAERYRWIRHGDNDESVLCGDCWGIYLPRNEHLDKAIDDKLELERMTTYLTQDRVLHGGGPAIDEAMK